MRTNTELDELGAWVAATPEQRRSVANRVLARLPGFEFAYVKTFAPPPDAPYPSVPLVTLCQTATSVLFNLIPGGAFRIGFSERQERALRQALEGADNLTEDDRRVAVDLLSDAAGFWRPVQEVHVAPFLLARFPLSAEQAARILGLDPEDEDVPRIELLGDPRHDPAGFVEDDERVLRAAGYRLPSEAEWEYACRAGSDTLFWWGDSLPTGATWPEGDPGEEETDRLSNGFGLVAMGALPELCADLGHESYDGIPADGSPWTEAPDGEGRVVRGGAALSYPWQGCGEWAELLSAYRGSEGTHDQDALRPVFPLPAL